MTADELERRRASGVCIDRRGRFMHEGQEVTHPGLRAALWRWLDRDADGRYVLRLDADRFVWLEVDDVPFVIHSLRWEGERAVALLSDGSEEALDLAGLRFGAAEAIYARVRGGRFEARLSAAAWAALGERIDLDDGVAVVVSDGRRHPIAPPPRAAGPRRADGDA